MSERMGCSLPMEDQPATWDVCQDRKADVLAFVHQKVDIRILVVPPSDKKGSWVGLRVGRGGLEGILPRKVAKADTEIEVVEAIEAVLQADAVATATLEEALSNMVAAGLNIDSVPDVLYWFAGTDQSAAERMIEFLKLGAGAAPVPSIGAGLFEPERIHSILRKLGIEESRAWEEVAELDAPHRATA